MSITLALTIGVPLAIVAYIVKSDKLPEPNYLIIKTFFVVVFLCSPEGFLNSYFFHQPITFMLAADDRPLSWFISKETF